MKRKSIYKSLLVLFFAFLLALPGITQDNPVIIGRVISISDNQPVRGANVRVEGVPGVFVETDSLGMFSINAPSYDVTIVLYYPGFKELYQFVGTSSELTCKLIPFETKSNLDEVVVNNGIRRQQRYTTQSVKTLTGDDFTERPYTSMEGYLYGKVAGVNVTAVDGMPATASMFNMRGIGSVTAGSQPLFIIDGMEISNLSNTGDWGSEAFNTHLYPTQLMALNVNDIENVTFLKDAVSKAIYGSRGGNGVVYIETSKGEKGKSQIDLMVNQGFDFKGEQLNVLNTEEHRQYMLEMALSEYGNQQTVLNRYGDYLFNNPHSLYYQDYNNSTVWQNKVQENIAYYGDYHFRIKGGDDVAKYSFSVGLTDKNGILKNTSMNNINGRFNLDYQVFEWFVIGTNLYFSQLQQTRHPMGFSRYNPFLVAYQKTPITAQYAKEPDGKITSHYQDHDVFGMSNPSSLAETTENEFKNNMMGGKIYAGFSFPNNFSASLSLGLHNQSVYDRLFLPQAGIAPLLDMFRISDLQSVIGLIFDGRIDVNYQNTFNNIHHVNVGVGANFLDDKLEYYFGSSINSGGDEYTRLDQGAFRRASNSGDERWRMIAGYMHGNYILKGRYIADMVMRVDGSSRFGIDKQVAFYPALGLAWRISEEDFLRNNRLLDDLKIRGSIGFSGNDNLGNYTAHLRYLPSNYKYLGGIALNRLANTKLTAERILEYNMGLDVSLFNQRLNFNFDIYDRTNQNMVLPVMLTLEQGNYVMMNSGKLNNRGVEATVSSYLKTGDVNWNFGISVAYNKNSVTELPKGIDMYEQSYEELFTAVASVGNAVGSYYGYRTEGVFSTDAEAATVINGDSRYEPFRGGDVKFVDINKDGIIDERDMTFLGKSMPDIFGGFQMQVSWKGITNRRID